MLHHRDERRSAASLADNFRLRQLRHTQLPRVTQVFEVSPDATPSGRTKIRRFLADNFRLRRDSISAFGSFDMHRCREQLKFSK
jgi:hypothetical protein